MRDSSENPVRSTRESDPVLSEILIEYISELPIYVGEMANLLARSEYDSLRQLIHQLKGSGGGYGFPRITQLAAKAEARIINADPLEELTAEMEQLCNYVRRVAGYDPAREKKNMSDMSAFKE